MSSLRTELGVMLEEFAALDGGLADERPFIDKWAKRIAALDAEPAEAESYDVLVSGDPVDGFTITGPYPRGTLDGLDDNSEVPCWVVPIEPTMTVEREGRS